MKKIILLFIAHAWALTLYAQGSLQLLGAGATVKSSAGAYIVLDNMNINNGGSIQHISGDGFVKLTGSSNVSLSGGGSTIIHTLLMAKGPGAIFSLTSDLNITSKVNFSGGLLNLNNNVLNLVSPAIFTGESNTSRAFTSGSGYIETMGVINSPMPVNLGKLGAEITPSINLGHTIIRRGHAIQTGVFGSNNSIRRYYDIIPMNNMNLKATLRFYYFDDELNATTPIPEPSLHQWKSKDNVNWDFVGADARDMATVDKNYVEKKAINKFERFTLATATAPAFTSCPGSITVTANQSGCKASVPFSATATGVPAPVITYRIGTKIITSPNVFPKGTTTVTATASNGVSPDAVCTFTVTVTCGQGSTIPNTLEPQEELPAISKNFTVIAYPNPSARNFNINVKANLSKEKITMQVVDMFGRIIEIRIVAANSNIRFGDKYRPGTYFIKISQGNQHKELKLIKVSD